MRGTLPGGEQGVLYHQVHLLDEATAGTFYGQKVSLSQARPEDLISLTGITGEPIRYVALQASAGLGVLSTLALTARLPGLVKWVAGRPRDSGGSDHVARPPGPSRGGARAASDPRAAAREHLSVGPLSHAYGDAKGPRSPPGPGFWRRQRRTIRNPIVSGSETFPALSRLVTRKR